MMHPELRSIMTFLSTFVGGPRWAIIRIIGEDEKTTSEIYNELIQKYGLAIPRSLLYYHLDMLEKAGVIEMVRYQETGKGGAPEKVWRVKIRKIILDLIMGEIKVEEK